jgi:hypothetical protein
MLLASNTVVCRKPFGRGLSHCHRFFLHTIIHPEVQHAISSNKPIVALESTIVAHGMPYPQNFQVAMEVESIIRTKVKKVKCSKAFDARRCLEEFSQFSPYNINDDTFWLCDNVNVSHRVLYQLPSP